MPAPATLRERKKIRTRDALVTAAYQLFATQGFDATTVDEIVDRVEVSRRTFFRYFDTKEAVVFPEREDLVARLRELLAQREPSEAPFTTLRRAFLTLAQDYMRNAETMVAQWHIVQASPALVAYELKLDMDVEEAIADTLLAGARADSAAGRRARIWASATLGIVRATLREWFTSDGTADLVALGAASFDLLEGGITKDGGTP